MSKPLGLCVVQAEDSTFAAVFGYAYRGEHAGEPMAPESMTIPSPHAEGSQRKLERVAMEGVRAGLIGYKLPEVEGREKGGA